jgi:hypothetical protein
MNEYGEEHEEGMSHIEELLHEETWFEKFQRIMDGLKEDPDSGEYKWARHEFNRIILPGISAFTSVLLLMICLAVFLKFSEEPAEPTVEVTVVEPEDVEIPPEEIEPPEEFEPPEEDVEPSDVVAENVTEVFTPEVMENPVTDTSVKPVEVTAVMMVNSPIVLRNLYANRSPGQKGEALAQFGGGGTEDAVLKALRWLKRNQNADGSWTMGMPSTPGAGLGLLCFLAYGATPQHKEFGPTVEKAIKFLVTKQQKDGNWTDTGGHHVYGNAIANYAISEAFAMTQIYSLKEVMDSGIQVIIDGQQGGGGWDYNYADGGRTDLSVMAWQAQALKAAKMAGSEAKGLEDAIYKCIPSFKSFQGAQGGFGYTSPGDRPLAAAGVLCLQLLGEAASPEVRKGIEYMYPWKMDWTAPEIKNPAYHWYYAAQAKFQAGGGTWTAWNDMMKPTLVKNQAADGHWDAPGGHAHVNSPVYTTTLACLMLEVYYRHLPTFQADHNEGAAKVEAKKAEQQGVAAEDDAVIKIL